MAPQRGKKKMYRKPLSSPMLVESRTEKKKRRKKKYVPSTFCFSTNSVNNTGNSSVFHLALRYIHWHHRYVLGLVSFVHDMNVCVCESQTPKSSSFLVWNACGVSMFHQRSGTKWTRHVSLIPILSKIVQSFTKIYFYSALTKDNSD